VQLSPQQTAAETAEQELTTAGENLLRGAAHWLASSLIPGLYVCVPCWRFLFFALGECKSRAALHARLRRRQDRFLAQRNGVVSPSFAGRVRDVDCCPWCFTLEVTQVTEQSQLAVLTALATDLDAVWGEDFEL